MIGRVVQNYKIEELIGEGGMGTVYRAVDILLGREVALKMLHPNLINQSSFFDRFKNEAQILARLNHPNIATLHNFLEDKGDYFMVMEYIHGQDLDQILKQNGPIAIEKATFIIKAICNGLTHAHEKGVLHRDLKPSNFILTENDEVKIMDFGIAKAVGSEKLTQVNSLIGTLEYMAPELLKGEEPSIQSDLYALGIVAYELISGKMPFKAKTDFDLMDQIIRQKPIKLNLEDNSYSPEIERVITKLLHKSPAKRFAKAQEVKLNLSSDKITAPVFKAPQLDFKGQFNRINLGKLSLPKLSKSAIILLLCSTVALGLIIFIPKNDSSVQSPKEDVLPQEEQIVQKTQTEVKSLPSIYKEKPDTPDLIQKQPDREPMKSEEDQTPKRKKSTIPEKKSPKKTTIKDNPKPIEEKEIVVDKPAPKIEDVKPIQKEEELSKPQKITLSGQKVTVSLAEKVNSKNLKTGQRIVFKVSKPLIINGKTVFAKNAPARGTISDLRKGTALRKELLELRITEVQASNGKWVKVKAATFRQTAKSSTQPVLFNIGQQFIAETSYTTLSL